VKKPGVPGSLPNDKPLLAGRWEAVFPPPRVVPWPFYFWLPLKVFRPGLLVHPIPVHSLKNQS